MPDQRVHVIDDNPGFQTFIREILRSEDFSVTFSSNGREARETCDTTAFDLILLDLSLPDCDGLEVFANLRTKSKNKGTPIVFLTSNDTLSSKIAAYALGADDYIAKDTDPLEIRSKLEAKLRNMRSSTATGLSLDCGPIRIDLASQRAYATGPDGSRELGLTALELRLLHFLARNGGRTYTREQILNTVWGGDVHVFDRTVDTHVYSLRKKLGDHAHLIESVQNVGYRFVKE